MKKKKILFICDAAEMGGAVISLFEMLEELKQYIDIMVIAPEDSKSFHFFLSKYKTIGMEVPTDVTLPKLKGEAFEKKCYLEGYQAAIGIKRIIIEHEVDLVHLNSSVSYAGALASILAGIPYVWHIRELISNHYGYVFSDTKKEMLSYATRIISISDYVKEEIKKSYGLESVRIYDGFDIEKYEYRPSNYLNHNRYSLLCLGQVSEQKGQWTAIKAVEKLLSKSIDVSLFIVGNRPDIYSQRLKKYIADYHLEDNIHILPFSEDISKWRKCADIELVCSREEALGRVTIEAMLSGNVVIGADSGATKEIIGDNNKRGLSFELDNVDDLVAKIIEVINMTKSNRCEMVNNAYNYAIKKFDSRNYAALLNQVYDDCIGDYCCQFIRRQEFEKRYKKYLESEEICDKCNSIKQEKTDIIIKKWERLNSLGGKIGVWLTENGIYQVAIYGMAYLGQKVLFELERDGIEVIAMVDQNVEENNKELGIFNSLECIDVNTFILVTVASLEKELVQAFWEKGFERTLGLSELIMLSTNLIEKGRK